MGLPADDESKSNEAKVMKILIVEQNAQAQAQCAARIERFSRADKETLDIRLKLVSAHEFLDRVGEADVVIMGPELGEVGVSLARQALAKSPWMHIIMFVAPEAYGGGAFRAAHSAGVRKVFPDSAADLDLLQELVSIAAEFRRAGRMREGKLIVFTHGKGGVGATTLVAGLGEVCALAGQKTLVWDLDVETRDLSRSLLVSGEKAKMIGGWISGDVEFNRSLFEEALAWINDHVAVLMPPTGLGEAMDLISHPEVVELVTQIVDTARVQFDVVLCDTGGRVGPFLAALLRAAANVVTIMDDSGLGVTATELHVGLLGKLIGGIDRLMLCVSPLSDGYRDHSRLAGEFHSVHQLGENPWQLPPVFFDPRGAEWAGSGKTLYGLGGRETKATLEQIAYTLGIIPERLNRGVADEANQANELGSGWLSKVIGRIPDYGGRKGG